MNLPPPNTVVADGSKDTTKPQPKQKKDAYYFPHDCTARNDPKLIKLRMKLGAEGYGIYFMILELLRGEADYKFSADYDAIAYDLRCDSDKIKSIINDFDLFSFTEDEKCFYSEGLNKRMTPLDNLRDQRSQAGKNGAQKRWGKKANERPANENIATATNSIATATKNYSNKIKENKINKIKEDEEIKENAENSPSPSVLLEIDQLAKECLGDPDFMRHARLNLKIDPSQLRDQLRLFNSQLKGEGITKKEKQDYRKHFSSWIRKRPPLKRPMRVL